MRAPAYRFVFIGLALFAGLTACNGGSSPAGSALAPQAARVSQAAVARAASTPDPRDLARYSSQLALTVLSFEELNFGFIASLIAPPSGCSNDETFSASGNIVTVSTFLVGANCTGTVEENSAYTIGSSDPFVSSYSSTATAGGQNYNATGILDLTANTLPFTLVYEVGQPAWGSKNSSNAQRGVALNITGTGSIGGKIQATGGSGTYAKAFSGTKAIAANETVKATKSTVKATVTGTLYEAASQSITIALSGSDWQVSGGNKVAGASIKATLVSPSGKTGEGGSFAYTYENKKDPQYPNLEGKVTASTKKLVANGLATVTMVQSGKTIATIAVDLFGYGTITFFDGSVEDITDFTVHSST